VEPVPGDTHYVNFWAYADRQSEQSPSNEACSSWLTFFIVFISTVLNLDSEETRNMNDYVLNITLAKGSGEYCISQSFFFVYLL